MRRRQLLRASAAAVGGGTAALAGARLAGDARAETALTLDATGDSATLGSSETVTGVTIEATIEWAYELPESASPQTVTIELAAGRDDPEVVATAQSAELFTSADGSEFLTADLLDAGVLTASALTPDTGSKETTVTVEARLRVEGADSVLARETATDEATLVVERDSRNASDYGRVGGSASLVIETGEK